MTYCPDPRPLAPPDDPPAPEPVPLWHFLSDDWEHEHWTQSSHEADQLMEAFAHRGDPYTVRQFLVQPGVTSPEDDAYGDDY